MSGDTAFLAVAGPEEASVIVLVELADEEDLVELDCFGVCFYFVPMLEVIGHVVAPKKRGACPFDSLLDLISAQSGTTVLQPACSVWSTSRVTQQ